MAGHLVSTPVSGFHICYCIEVEQAPFWSQGPLVNGVKSWKLIIKHDLTYRFHGGTLGVPPVSEFHIGEGTNVEPAHFWSQCTLVDDVRSWQLIIKHDLTHRFHGQATCCPPQCPGITSVRAPMWNRPISGARVHLRMVSEVGN